MDLDAPTKKNALPADSKEFLLKQRLFASPLPSWNHLGAANPPFMFAKLPNPRSNAPQSGGPEVEFFVQFTQ